MGGYILSSSLYQSVKEAYGMIPQSVQGQFTARTAYYRRVLYNIIKGMLNVSADIDFETDYVKNTLLTCGAIGCFESDLLGKILYVPQFYSPNIYLECGKARYVIQNFDGRVYEREIGYDTEVVYLFDQQEGGIMDSVSIYAEKLASIDASIDVNSMNTRNPIVAEVETSQQQAMMQKMYDDATNGKPCIIVRKSKMDSGINITPFNTSNMFIIDKLQDAKRTIMNEFLTTFGINNANTDKRERLNADEVHSNDSELRANTALIRKNLREGCDRINAMFDINLSITLDDNAGGAGYGNDA